MWWRGRCKPFPFMWSPGCFKMCVRARDARMCVLDARCTRVLRVSIIITNTTMHSLRVIDGQVLQKCACRACPAHAPHAPASLHPPHSSRRRAGRHPLEQRVSIAAVHIDSRGAHCAVVQHLAMQRRQGDVYVLVTRVGAARSSGDVLYQVVGRARPPGRDGDEQQHGQQQEWAHQGSRPAWLRAKGSYAW